MKCVYTAVIIAALACFACKGKKQDKPVDSNKVIARLPGIDSISPRHVSPDTIYTLLGISSRMDTFKFDSYDPFLFLKTGQLFTDSVKHAVLITCPSDSIYHLELFSLHNKKWFRKQEIDSLEAFPIQFDIRFVDFNFDGLKDVYIQYSASNGYSLSRGHLFTMDPHTMRLVHHPEAGNLANMSPDPETKTVNSEQVIECGKDQQTAICILRNKWVTGKLTLAKKDCPCEQEKH